MNKRLLVTSATGLVLGIIDWQIVKAQLSMMNWDLPLAAGLGIVASILIIGIAIGLSQLKQFTWWQHGMLIAVVFSLPRSVGNAAWGWLPVVQTLVTVLICGVVIELCATIFFGAPMKGKKGL